MSIVFNCREVEYPLFGAAFRKGGFEAFRQRFAADIEVGGFSLRIDDGALAIICMDLGVHADCVVRDALDYVEGRFRPKAEGLTGGRLGEFGEIVAYLHGLAHYGHNKLVRIVGYHHKDRKQVRYPQPDFYVTKPNGQVGVMEVKSTEALKVLKYSQKERGPRTTVCRGVSYCRDRAKAQLGLHGEELPKFGHQLVLRVGGRVSYPSEFLDVVALLCRDGRIDALDDDNSRERLIPPKECQRLNRNCKKCLSNGQSASHLTLVRMTHSPQQLLLLLLLQLLDGPRWFNSYRNWALGLTTGSVAVVKEKSKALAVETRKWLIATQMEGPSDSGQQAWADHITTAAAERGYDIGDVAYEVLSTSLDDTLRRQQQSSTNSSESRPQWIEEVDSIDAALERARVLLTPKGVESAAYSFSYLPIEETQLHASLRVTEDAVSLSIVPANWDATHEIGEERAHQSASHLLEMALNIYTNRRVRDPRMPTHLLTLKKVGVQVGDRRVELGWVVDVRKGARQSAHEFAVWPYFLERRTTALLWILALVTGDPRVQLLVFPDGRARLTVPKSLL